MNLFFFFLQLHKFVIRFEILIALFFLYMYLWNYHTSEYIPRYNCVFMHFILVKLLFKNILLTQFTMNWLWRWSAYPPTVKSVFVSIEVTAWNVWRCKLVLMHKTMLHCIQGVPKVTHQNVCFKHVHIEKPNQISCSSVFCLPQTGSFLFAPFRTPFCFF